MGAFGAAVVPGDARILTHCNAGALATAGYGTALGVIRGAVEAGKQVAVFADETRPFLQGARLTAWELVRDGIDTTVITDNMAGALMRQGQVELRRRRRRPHRRQRRHRQQDRHLHAWPCWRASTAFRSTSPRRCRRSISSTPDGAHIPIEERNAARGDARRRHAAGAGRRAASGIRRSTSRRIASSPASSPSAASAARPYTESLKRARFASSGHADPRHRDLLRRDVGRRRRGDRRRRRARGRSARTSSRRRCRFTASGAASCRSSRRGSTSATSAASSSARSRRPAPRWPDLGAIAVTQGPGLVGSLLVGVSFAKAAAAAAGLPLVAVHHLAGHIESLVLAERRAAAARGRARRLGRPHEPVSRRAARAATSCSAARATMRRARRTTRWRSCSASAIRAVRSIDRLARTGNDRAIALPTTRLTHADRNAPELKGDLDFSFSGLKTAVLRHVRSGRSRAGRRCRTARSPTSAPASSASSSTALDRPHVRRGAAAPGARASASPAACRRTAACARSSQAHGDAREMPTFVPSLPLSTDNAAMIAAAGLRKFRAGVPRRSTSTPTRRCRSESSNARSR